MQKKNVFRMRIVYVTHTHVPMYRVLILSRATHVDTYEYAAIGNKTTPKETIKKKKNENEKKLKRTVAFNLS